jgi:hypothetical protein
MRLLLPLVFLLAACSTAPPPEPPPEPPFEIPVVVVKFFPVDGDSIDINTTGDWGRSLAFTQAKTDTITRDLIAALEAGSRYHGYKDSTARPSLDYRVVETFEYLEPLPTIGQGPDQPPMTDYPAILRRIDAQRWVDGEGVKEFWIWGYHGGRVKLWESNMAGPYGDVSNSDRNPSDLPIYRHTYTVYHYNYQRGTAEAMETHMHQLEHVLNHFDGRDITPPPGWPDLLFWGKFVGSDSTHHLLDPRRAGWSHYPPNAERDYQWDNPDSVLTDIEDWRPDGSGAQRRLGCARWGCDHLQWFIYWNQNIPGHDNGLTYQGKPLQNWWLPLADFDYAARNGLRLWVND